MKKCIWIALMVILTVSLVLTGCASSPGATSTPAATTTTTAAATTTAAPIATSAMAATKTAAPTTTTAAATTAASTLTPVDGGVLRIIATEGASGSIGVPEKMSGMSSFYIGMMIEPVLQVSTSKEVVYKLVTSLEWSTDNKTLTLHLRKGVKFHDGTDWNAAAMDWNIQKRIIAKSDGTENIVSTRVLDDYTYQFGIKSYQNTWLGKLGGTMGYMISPTAYDSKGLDYTNWHPVGTGPFKFKSYKENQYLETERFSDYWGDKPHLDGIKYVFIADPVTAQIAFESGEGDIISVMTGGQKLASELKAKGYKIESSEGTCITLIPSSGNPKSPFANVKVRQAVDYAINKEKIAKNIGLGYWKPMYNLIGSAGGTYDDPSFKERSYNPAKAKALLAEAGYPNGFKTTLYWGQHLAGDEVPAIQADLLAIGIDAKIELVSVAKWIEMETNGWDEGLEGSWVNVNFDLGTVLLRYWVRPLQPNWGRGIYWNALYRPDDLENLIQQYLVTSDVPGQQATGKQIAKLMFDQAIAIPVAQPLNTVVLQQYVNDRQKGVVVTGGWSYTNIWMAKK